VHVVQSKLLRRIRGKGDREPDEHGVAPPGSVAPPKSSKESKSSKKSSAAAAAALPPPPSSSASSSSSRAMAAGGSAPVIGGVVDPFARRQTSQAAAAAVAADASAADMEPPPGMSDQEIDRQLDLLMSEMNIPEDKRLPILQQDRNRKWYMIVVHRNREGVRSSPHPLYSGRFDIFTCLLHRTKTSRM
jgi:hypothetical protein